MKKFLLRLQLCYRIFFRKYNHFLILDIKEDQLEKLLNDEKFGVDVSYHGIQPYIFHKIIKEVSLLKDDIDMALDKAAFQAAALEHIKKTK